MRRKVARIGPATLMVSLPSKWTKQFQIQKGDEIDIEVNGSTLLLSTPNILVKEPKLLDISQLPYRYVRKSILSLYKQGYDEIKIIFKNKEVRDLKSNDSMKTEDLLQNIIKDLIGFEIIDQRTNSITIKNITTPSPQEFNNILRRIFLLILGYMEDSLEALKQKDQEALNDLTQRKANMARFINYALRLLSTGSAQTNGNTQVMYMVVTLLYRFMDTIWYINVEQQENLAVTSKCLETYQNLYKSYSLMYNLFYKFSTDKAEQIFILRRKGYDSINSLKKNKDVASNLFGSRLAVAFNEVYNLTEAIIGMRIVN